jgi:hypothetical protein
VTEWERGDDLRAFAAAAGYSVTKEQLARWHRAGLLPRPETRHRVGERGTESLYPPGTAVQLVVLCQLHATDHRLGHVGFRLWWAGFTVEASVIREFAAKVATDLDEASQSFAGFLDESGELTPAAAASLVDVKRAPSAVRQVHRRASKRGTDPTGFAQLVTAVARLTVRDDLQATPEHLDRLQQSLGLDAAQLGTLGDGEAVPQTEVSGGLELIQGLFVPGRFSEAIGEATDAELVATRDRARVMFGALSTLGKVLRDLDSPVGIGLKLLSSALDEWTRSAEGLCYLLLLALIVSVQDEMRRGMEELREPFEHWSSEGVRHWQLIQQLRADVPELRPILTPPRLRRSIESDTERKRLQDDLAKARRKYASKIDAVVAAHPEFAIGPEAPDTT